MTAFPARRTIRLLVLLMWVPISGCSLRGLSAGSPEITSLNCPTTVRAGEESTYSAAVAGDAPGLSFEWEFGSDPNPTGLELEDHSISDPGIHEVTFMIIEFATRDTVAARTCRVEVTA